MTNLIEETERKLHKYFGRLVIALSLAVVLLVVRAVFYYGFDEYDLNSQPIGIAVLIATIIMLVITAGINLYRGHQPETTFWGIVIAAISIFTMWALIYFKVKVGRQLNSDAILEDANCTKACLYLSFTLLLASVGFELTGIGGIDSIGAILIAIFSFREGRESFEKSHGESCHSDRPENP